MIFGRKIYLTVSIFNTFRNINSKALEGYTKKELYLAAIDNIKELAKNEDELRIIDTLVVQIFIGYQRKRPKVYFCGVLLQKWGHERFFKALKQWKYADACLIGELHIWMGLNESDIVNGVQTYLNWNDQRVFLAFRHSEIHDSMECLLKAGWNEKRVQAAKNIATTENVAKLRQQFS